MTQYHVLASEGRQRYIYIKKPKNIYREKKFNKFEPQDIKHPLPYDQRLLATF
jgi:hypothetical protein